MDVNSDPRRRTGTRDIIHLRPMFTRQHASSMAGLRWVICLGVSGRELQIAGRQDLVHEIPGFLDLLRDMSSYNPSNRISAAEALARFRILRSRLQCEDLLKTRERELLEYPLIPRSFWRMFIDIVQTGRLVIAARLCGHHPASCTFFSYIPLVRTFMPAPIGCKNVVQSMGVQAEIVVE